MVPYAPQCLQQLVPVQHSCIVYKIDCSVSFLDIKRIIPVHTLAPVPLRLAVHLWVIPSALPAFEGADDQRS
jgi:hypothetical protein